jgi:hypothetical protein
VQFFVMGMVQVAIYAAKPQNLDGLKWHIKEITASKPMEMLHSVQSAFNHMLVCFQNNGQA